ncbi:preprotein translocase subunit SecE [Candidatus Saccharibacteria bacterium HGW-Saccharibacteria-1]|nr:MAG: preprotein translocase subunit SecE [Candidatus Saccharibacteria bacterium HGW-Saccharibacteria-1]
MVAFKKDKKPSKKIKSKVIKPKKPKKGIFKLLAAIGGYFKGAWIELKQVRWPNRSATWSLTLAVILFSAFFLALIVFLDAGFKYLFELILKK